MGQLRPELLEKLVKLNRGDKHTIKEFDEGAPEALAEIRDAVFELLLFRARDFMYQSGQCDSATGVCADPEDIVAHATLDLYITDGLFHAPAVEEKLFVRGLEGEVTGTDSGELLSRLRKMQAPCD